jgi:ATP-dependent exoDNAse (exonuclease V) beta subunit
MHPILEQMVLSEEQWSPVLARGKDVVVTAGAGTGKTHTLVARYLWYHWVGAGKAVPPSRP